MLWRNPHRRFQERLSAHLDGELPPEDAAALQAHLESCDSCREELAAIRLASAALAELPDVEAPRSFALTPEHVARPAVPPQAVRSVNSGLRLTGGALAAALAVLLVLDLGGVVGNDEREDGGGGTEVQRQAAYDTGTGAADSSEAPPPAPAGPGIADGDQGGIAAVSPAPQPSPTPHESGGLDEAAISQATGTPAPTEMQGEAAAKIGLNGSEGEDTETFTPVDSITDSDDGLSALTVAEIALAALLGASIIGIGAATFAGRRRG